MTIYDYPGCLFGRKVRIVLAEKELSFDSVQVDLVKGQQRSDEMLLTGDTATKVQQVAVAKVGSAATVVRVETDADGHAQSQPLPAGRYWVFGDGKVDNRAMLWNQPVDVKAGPATVTLDQRNASPVD